MKPEDYFNIYQDPNFKNPDYRYPEEVFKDIIGFEGLYQISNMGRVLSLSRLKWNGSVFLQLKAKILAVHVGKGKFAYYSIHLYRNNKGTKFHIHRLVAMVFIGKPYKATVNHKNGVKAHNFDSNLEWATYAENNQHASSTGLMNQPHGVDNYFAKLTDEKVREIRILLSDGISQRKIAKIYGISRGPIQRIAEKTGWKHVKL
jgi:hypothetical protein